jgi:predicted transcriptional regulator
MNKHVVHGHIVEPDLEQRLERVAKRMNMSTTELVNMAVDFFLERAETPEEELAGLEEERAEYQKNPVHLTNDEVKEWLERLANSEDAPMPKPHL